MSRKWTAAKKRSWVMRYVLGLSGDMPKISIKRCAKEAGINRTTLGNWLKAYAERGEDSFRSRAKRAKFKRKQYRSDGRLLPREVAMVRYGMVGLTDAQVGALLGKSREHINRVRRGEAGGQVAAPPTPPVVRSEMEANTWFLHKALKTIDSWIAMLDKLKAEGNGADLQKDLMEADHEDRIEHPIDQERRRAKQAAQKHRDAARQQRIVDARTARELRARLSQGEAADARGLQAEYRLPGAGAGAADPAPATDGFILRRRR